MLTKEAKLLKALISIIWLFLQCKLKILLNKIEHFKKGTKDRWLDDWR